MDRKTYMKDIYSKYWITARENEYGFLEYDKNLCDYVIKNVDKQSNILEVAIGTGFPFGDFFQKKGFNMYGIDIAPALIEKCKELNNKIICKIGDAENIEYPDNFFQCTYSFHSTFYFPDLQKVIDEMLRVTSPKGLIIFDIQNRNNYKCEKNYNQMILNKKNNIRKVSSYIKNIFKFFLRKGVQNWSNVIHEVPTYPEAIYQYLEKANIRNYSVMVKTEDEKLLTIKKIGPLKDYPRIIFSFNK